jgi:hypothetical protein
MAQGGARTPSNPAPVGLPGALSQRTDGGPSQPMAQLPDAGYGEQADFQAIQAGAPMAAMDPMSPPPAPLASPTDMPNVPVTAGLPFGPGPGPTGENPVAQIEDADLRNIAKYLPQFQSMASGEDVPAGYLRFLTQLRAYL